MNKIKQYFKIGLQYTKNVLFIIFGIITTLFNYILYVADNALCILGFNPKSSFTEFMKLKKIRTSVYIRVFFFLPIIILILWLTD